MPPRIHDVFNPDQSSPTRRQTQLELFLFEGASLTDVSLLKRTRTKTDTTSRKSQNKR